MEQGALSSEVSKSPIFIVGMVSQLYQLYNQSFFLTTLTFPWRFSFLLWSSLLSFLASTSDTKRSKKNSKLSLLRIDTYYWIIGAEIEFNMKSENSTWTIIIWIMKLIVKLHICLIYQSIAIYKLHNHLIRNKEAVSIKYDDIELTTCSKRT